MADTVAERELWILGLGNKPERGGVVSGYLNEAGMRVKIADVGMLENERPLGIILDVSTHSADGWGILLDLKSSPATRDIPILPVFLSEVGKVGGVFPVAGFFTLPIDIDYLVKKLTVLGLTEDAETWDLQALVVSRKGEESVTNAIRSIDFEVVHAYTGKEGVALATIDRPYLIFSTLMVPDMSAFEMLDKLRLYPQTRNIPFFVLIKDTMKDGERIAMSRQVEHLVRKNWLSQDEFMSYFRRTKE